MGNSGGLGTFNQSGGTNTVTSTLSLGTSGIYNLTGGALLVPGIQGTGVFNLGGGTLVANAAFSTAQPMTLTGSGGNGNINTGGYAITLSGLLSGSGGLNVSGAGTLILTASNSYTGTTAVNNGTLKLDFSAIGAPGEQHHQQHVRQLRAGLGGGTLTIQGKLSVANSQRFNGLTVNAGASALQAVSGSGGTVSVSLGAITRNAGGTIDFTLPASGGIATTTTTTASGVLVDNKGTAYATDNGGSTFATLSGGKIVGLTTYSNTNSFLARDRPNPYHVEYVGQRDNGRPGLQSLQHHADLDRQQRHRRGRHLGHARGHGNHHYRRFFARRRRQCRRHHGLRFLERCFGDRQQRLRR